MKSKFIFLLLFLGYLSKVMATLPSVYLKGTNKVTYTTCIASDDPTLRLDMGVTLSNDTIHHFGIELWEMRDNKPDLNVFTLGLNNYIFTIQNGKFDIVIKQNSIVVKDSLSDLSASFKRRDMTFYILIKKFDDAQPGPNNWSLVGGTNTNPFTIFAGKSPSFNISNPQNLFIPALPRFTPTKRNVYTVYSGCEDSITQYGRSLNFIRIRLDSSQTCANERFTMVMWEIDKITGLQKGSKYWSTLNASEMADFKGTSGLKIGSWLTDGPADSKNGPFGMSPGKTYVLSIEYTGQTIKKATYVTINYSPIGWDLAMRDNKASGADYFEPGDIWDNDLFRSPDLWNKLSSTVTPNDSTNENPDHVTVLGHSNKMLFKVHNNGCLASPANVPLRLYWTRARTNEIFKNHWIYDTVNNVVFSKAKNKNVPAGSEITITGATMTQPYNNIDSAFLLASIAGKGKYTLSYSNAKNWFPPDPVDFDSLNGYMGGAGKLVPAICFMARINTKTSTYDPVYYEPTGTGDTIDRYVRFNNNVVARNCYIVNNPNFSIWYGGGSNGWHHGFTTIEVNNPSTDTAVIHTNLCVDLLPAPDLVGTFGSHGFIEVALTNDLFTDWQNGGSSLTGMTHVSSTLFKITNSTKACLNNVALPSLTSEHIGIRFNFDDNLLPGTPRQFYYRLSQQSTDSIDSTYYIEHLDSVLHHVGTDTFGVLVASDTIPHKVALTTYRSSLIFDVPVPTTPPAGAVPFLNVKTSGTARQYIFVYPNPASDAITVNVISDDTNSPSKLELTDIRGTLIRQYQPKGSSFKIGVTDLPNGVYFITFRQGNNVQTQKITIIH